ncbi:hypothetical protein [Paraglaciecola polaris]|uniref:hypothetical protein n=1 Tax=Paraglaciecola polaris TaxID=222814 RepID=UPI003AB97BDB
MISIKATSYLLVMLILFQSFSAVANSLNFHSIDSEHLSEVHELNSHDNITGKTMQVQQNTDLPTNTDNSTFTDTSHNPADCHHCGHCNGTHLSYLGTSQLQSTPSITRSINSIYLDSNKSTQPSSLYRPPKTQS